MNKLILFALSVLVLTGCSIQRWEGKSRDALLSKKGMPDKVENNGEDQIYYYYTTDGYKEIIVRDENGKVTGSVDSLYKYEIYAIAKSNSIFFASQELSYVAPMQFTVIEE